MLTKLENFIDKKIIYIFSIFLIIQPLIDSLTGIFLSQFDIEFTLSSIIRIVFLLIAIYYTCFISKTNGRKFLLWLLLYSVVFVLCNAFIKENTSIFFEIKYLINNLYFPIMLIFTLDIAKNNKLNSKIIILLLPIYLILICVPNMLDIGLDAYAYAKEGSVGFFYSANSIGNIISILTPLFLSFLVVNKKYKYITIFLVIYVLTLLSMGTKSPIIFLILIILYYFIILIYRLIKRRKYVYVLLSFILILFLTTISMKFVPTTSFYKNLVIHLNFLEINNLQDLLSFRNIDHFLFGSRFAFLKNNLDIYMKSSLMEKLFGIGYMIEYNQLKISEMDFFDIFIHQGIIGFILILSIYFRLLYIIFKNYLKNFRNNFKNIENTSTIISICISIICALFIGHVLTTPSVSIYVCIILCMYLNKLNVKQEADMKKKKIIFLSCTMCMGGIEKALVELLNNINYDKYDVTLLLEKEEGELLDKINKNVKIYNYNICNSKFILYRKIVNALKRLKFIIFNKNKYDFSCCYATYSKPCSVLSLIASKNSSIYIHGDYVEEFNDTNKTINFFRGQRIDEFKKIVFVSNESKENLINVMPDIKGRSIVLNNFINYNQILDLSKEKINEKKQKDKTLLLYVGRLDEEVKKTSKMIETVKYLIDNNLKVEFWIVGNGKDYNFYKNMIQKNNLQDNIKLLGMKKNPYPYIKLSDYVVITSEHEGFPVTFLEALALNKKIISTISVSDDEIDLSKYGYIVSKDTNKMKEEVLKILLNNDSITRNVDFEKINENRIKKLELLIEGDNNEI